MGILDDLKSQAEAQKASEEQEKHRQANLLKYYEKNLHPKMMQLYSFLNEFIEHLNYINNVTKVSRLFSTFFIYIPLRCNQNTSIHMGFLENKKHSYLFFHLQLQEYAFRSPHFHLCPTKRSGATFVSQVCRQDASPALLPVHLFLP